MSMPVIHRVVRDTIGQIGASDMACGVSAWRYGGPSIAGSPAEYAKGERGFIHGTTFAAEVTCKRCQRSKPKKTA